MKTKTDRYSELYNRFVMVMNKIAALEKSSRDFGTGDQLFPSEIHAVDAIGKNPGIKMTDLAALLGISKPAVTQIIGKVLKKNLVERYNGQGNLKEVLLRLTKTGRIAFRRHREFHARMDADIINQLEKLTSREFNFLFKLYGDMALYVDLLTKERKPEVSLNQSSDRKRGKI